MTALPVLVAGAASGGGITASLWTAKISEQAGASSLRPSRRTASSVFSKVSEAKKDLDD